MESNASNNNKCARQIFHSFFPFPPNRWRKKKKKKNLPRWRRLRQSYQRSEIPLPAEAFQKPESGPPEESFTLPSSEFEPRGKHFSSQHQWLHEMLLHLSFFSFLLLFFLMLPTSASFFLQPKQRLSDSQPRLLNNDRFKRVAEAEPAYRGLRIN